MAKSVVSIVKGTDAEKMVTEALDLLGGVTSLIKPNSTVVIKPNAGHINPPEDSVNTSPGVVAAVIKEIRKANPKEIIVAESGALDTLIALDVSGIAKAARDAGADKIIDIKREKDLINVPIRDANSDMKRVLLPRFLIEADHIVNVPIFKPHVSMVFTCALKNIKGVVQAKTHREMHLTNLADAMMDLWSVIKPDLQIADMIVPLEGFGPRSGLPIEFGCVVASKDPVALDATACRMVGLDIKQVTYFDAARKRGLGNFNEKDIEIRGQKIKDVFKQIWLPYLGGFEQWPEYNSYAEEACSSCQGQLAYTMVALKALGEYDKNAGIAIVAGPRKELPKELQGVPAKNIILMGNCVRKHRNQGLFVEGCPPGEPNTYWTIVERSDMNKEMTPAMRDRRSAEVKTITEHVKKLRDEVRAKTKAKK